MKHLMIAGAVASLGLVLIAGCSSADDPAEPAPESTSAYGDCTDTLEHFRLTHSNCPDTYTGSAEDIASVCAGSNAHITSVGEHDGYAFIDYVVGASATICAYRSSDATLIGMWVGDDGNYFCNETSNTITAGELPDLGAGAVDYSNCQ